MAFLLILLLLFGFVLGGLGSGSSSMSGQFKPAVKCSKRMAAKAPSAQERRCGPPPANP
jgi:hypothetical protein